MRALVFWLWLAVAAGIRADDVRILAYLTCGSVLTGTAAEEKIPVVTQYGTLHIPLGELRTVVVGAKFTPQEKQDLEKWLKDLDSSEHAERERATKGLEGLGPRAVSRLDTGTAGLSLEARRRRESVLVAIRKSHPGEPPSTSDVITAAKMSVRGELGVSEIKLKDSSLGPVSLGFSKVKKLHACSLAPQVFMVRGTDHWTGTGITVPAGTRFQATAAGEITTVVDAEVRASQPPGINVVVSGSPCLFGVPGLRIKSDGEPGTTPLPFSQIYDAGRVTAPAAGEIELIASTLPSPQPTGGTYIVTLRILP